MFFHKRMPDVRSHPRRWLGPIGAALRGGTSLACEEINAMVLISFSEGIARVAEPGPSPASGPAAWAVMLTGLVLYNALTPTVHDREV